MILVFYIVLAAFLLYFGFSLIRLGRGMLESRKREAILHIVVGVCLCLLPLLGTIVGLTLKSVSAIAILLAAVNFIGRRGLEERGINAP